MHALRAIVLSWAVLSAVLGSTMAVPYGWFDFFLPVGGLMVIPVAMVAASLIVMSIPIDRIGEAIVGELRGDAADGRLRNVADELSIAIGEAPGHVLVHATDVPNVGAFPTKSGVVVLATAGAVEQLGRYELEALVAAQFAGMRDRWCRLATRAELAWKLTIVVAFASILFALPLAYMICGLMLFAPRSVEATRDLCADVAAVAATRHPAALADALRHLVPTTTASNRERFVRRWYLPVSPFLAMPKRLPSTTYIGRESGPTRSYTDVDEVTSELLLRADRAEALAAGADPREFTGREYRRRWSKLGTTDSNRPA